MRHWAILIGMGLEARCRCRYAGRISEGRAQLETTELRFRGDFSLAAPLQGIKAHTHDGELRIEWGSDVAVLELGAASAKWADKILHPPSLLDKLGIKKGMRVGMKGDFDQQFVAELRARTDDLAAGRMKKESDLLFLSVDKAADLGHLPRLIPALAANGGLWIVYPKGQKDIRQIDVMMAARNAGLVDVKVASFSPTHTALKFVIPKAKR